MKEEKEFLNKLLQNGDVIVFACSGGPDSMCLLSLLTEQSKKKSLKLICAHINHNKRKESKEEYFFVKKYCEERNILFEGTEFKNYSTQNFHQESHQKRRKFYETLIEKYHAKYLMTAHHGDDLIETILMRLTRGSSINGYKGFNKIHTENNYTLVRPLITATKIQIKEYDDQNQIPYVIDTSNDLEVYTRNRYRHNVLPFLKKENKNVHRKFLQFNEQMCRINEFLVKYTSNALTDCKENDNLLIVEIKKYDLLIQQEIIKKYLYQIYGDDINLLKENHLISILNLMHSEKSNGKINLPQKMIVKKNYNYLKIEKANKDESFLIELKEEVIENNFKIYKLLDTLENTNNIIRLNSKEITLPLYLRTRKKEDKIEVKNFKGHQKIKKIFIDQKIPLDNRDNWPILVDSNDRILWVPGLKKSKFDKEISQDYDIIYKYELSKEKNYATKK